MKTGKMLYLVLIICIFIFLWIPYFQNVATPVAISFLGGTPNFISVYPRILFLGMIEGVLITIYIQTLLRDIKYQEPTKFDLNP
ncbi:MAG: hypothetical protein ACD_80C00145G0053 [uncultured bacterium (gcode 4)]|uniref:Uncharacterized protein n=1 Tax=uncultured bacterium (gcode 4) TaxID=1234023 RepID=K1YHS4_9BACT|nr:MAG: hypothetical protein ACD_80C00145G0053 [uncultured bacterium (gcode 4)]HBB03761.1 hypothetical protein [Candidatus Gracilibacteria bacterium]